MMTAKRTFYYACECPYGIYAVNRDGAQADEVHRFGSGLERDNWVMMDPEHREPLSANHPRVRAAKQSTNRHGLEWPVAVR